MNKKLNTIVGVLVLIIGFYNLINLILLLFGKYERTLEELLIPLFIIIIYFILRKRTKYKIANEENIKSNKLDSTNKLSRYIITASSEVCSYLANSLKSNELVYDTYENSGNWYTNGETGPEWYTVTVETFWKYKEKVENLVELELKKIGKTIDKGHWS
ncbi:MAG: hypothetical protein HWD82_01860 [Flavobacteriaceae bacterium]|nr:hypothetical protein [Flavobacteriaceae bacterium]